MEKIIAQFEAAIAEYDAILTPVCHTVESHQYIVLDPYDQAIKFTREQLSGGRNRFVVSDKVRAHKANRFEYKAAKQIARQLGGCSVMHYRDAATIERDSLVEQLAGIRKRMAEVA